MPEMVRQIGERTCIRLCRPHPYPISFSSNRSLLSQNRPRNGLFPEAANCARSGPPFFANQIERKLNVACAGDRFGVSPSTAAPGRGLPFRVGVGKLPLADPRSSTVGFWRAWRTAAVGHDRSFNPQKRSAFERLLSGFILRIGMLAPLAGVGGIAVTQYFPCRESAFWYRAAASNKSIAGWRPNPASHVSPNRPVSQIQILRTGMLRSGHWRLHPPGQLQSFIRPATRSPE